MIHILQPQREKKKHNVFPPIFFPFEVDYHSFSFFLVCGFRIVCKCA